MKRAVLGMLALCFCADASHAGGAGSTAAQFLSIRPGARAAGMGQTGVAEARDATALYWNPAGLVRAARPALGMTHMEYLEGLRYDYAAYVNPLTDYGALSVGVIALYSGPIPKTTESSAGEYQATDQTFTSMESALVLGWGARVNNELTVGLGVKGISQRIDTVSATGAAIDAGAGYDVSDMVRVGAALRNLGTSMKGNELPAAMALGCSIRVPNKKMVITADADVPLAGAPAIGAGVETEIARNVYLREGYTTRPETGGLSGLTAGLGIVWQQLTFDYGFGLYGDAGGTHMLSINYGFRGKPVSKMVAYPYTVDFAVPGRNMLKFEGLPRRARIQILNDSGTIVRAIDPGMPGYDAAKGTAQWNGTDIHGVRVAPGLYRYTVTDRAGRRKTGAFRVAEYQAAPKKPSATDGKKQQKRQSDGILIWTK